MSDQIDALIQEIASKHGIAVARNDPILILQTINHRLLQDGVAAQESLLESFKSEIESVSMRWGMDAKEKADRILNGALTAARESIQQSYQEGAAIAAAAVKREGEAASRAIRSSARAVKAIAVLNVIAALVTTGAAVVMLWIYRAH